MFKRSSSHKKEDETEKPEPTETESTKDDGNIDDQSTKPIKRKLRKTEEESGPPPVLFHGADESKGEYRNFSNMSGHRIDVDGTQFPTVEHYFQAMKAKEFKDDEIYEKIVKAKSAKAVKALGKKVKGFITEIWESKRDEVMRTGIKAKFVQHPELRKQLQETDQKMIGEADARNTYWGIGTSMASEKSKHPSKWRGQNKIGRILMDLRKQFQGES